jgi:ferredoxin, 2Fe-2S
VPGSIRESGEWAKPRDDDVVELHKASVRVEPLGEKIEVAEGETIFEAASRHGYDWPTRCHGQAQCTFCWLEVESGHANTLDSGIEEELILDRIRRVRGATSDVPYRLACRLKIKGDVVVRKDGVLKTES